MSRSIQTAEGPLLDLGSGDGIVIELAEPPIETRSDPSNLEIELGKTAAGDTYGPDLDTDEYYRWSHERRHAARAKHSSPTSDQ